MTKLENQVDRIINKKVEHALKKNPWGKWWLDPSLTTVVLPVFGRVMHLLISIHGGERRFNMLRSSRMSAREIEQGLCLGLIVRITTDLAHPLYYNTPISKETITNNMHYYDYDELRLNAINRVKAAAEQLQQSDFEKSKLQLFKYSRTPTTTVIVKPSFVWQLHFRDHSW